MSPHAISPSPSSAPTSNGHHDAGQRDGKTNGIKSKGEAHKSFLQHTPEDQVHDLICVGFGPASLAIAIALHDALELQDSSSLELLNGRPPKVAFLEKQECFAWHSGMLLEGARMQITFIKDMATLRNPRSSFTFLNYLHQKDRLVQFTNLSTFLPQRIEFEDYLKWCAGWFDDVVQYGKKVLSVSPDYQSFGRKGITRFLVTYLDVRTGLLSSLRSRHVVIAVGGNGIIPPPFPQKHPRIIHSSQYATVTPHFLKHRDQEYRIAVIGSGQSAAEIFDDLHSQYPNSQTSLIIKGTALRPSDDSPFVNEIFDPSRVSEFFGQPASVRESAILENRCTNYGVVRLELLERLYEKLYMQRIRHGNDERDWPHRIIANSTVVAVNVFDKFVSICTDVSGSDGPHVMDFDFVIVATGYTRNEHEILLGKWPYDNPGRDQSRKSWTVGRDYHVNFQSEPAISDEAGVWLQGCNEDTHGVRSSCNFFLYRANLLTFSSFPIPS